MSYKKIYRHHGSLKNKKFKNASAFLLRGARHLPADIKVEHMEKESVCSTFIFLPSAEVGVILHLI